MEQIQEETILALLIDKPAEGIRILTAQYGGLVYSITWRRLQGCLRKEDIEECVSDIFFELYRCRDKIDLSKGSLKTFLLTIAERQAIKYYERKTDKFDKISLQEQLEKGLGGADGEHCDPEVLLWNDSKRNRAAGRIIQKCSRETIETWIRKVKDGAAE